MPSELWEAGAHIGGDVQIVIRHDATNLNLLEIESVEFSIDRMGRVGGAGIGHPRHRYHKYGVAEGTFTLRKGWLNASAQGTFFASLVEGTTQLQTEAFSSGDATLVLAYQPTYILAAVVTGGNQWDELEEPSEYTVTYSSSTVTFVGTASQHGYVIYTTNDSTLVGSNAMDGRNHPLMFDIELRRRSDATVLKRLRGCAPYTWGVSSGGIGEEAWTEDLSGNFLALDDNG